MGVERGSIRSTGSRSSRHGLGQRPRSAGRGRSAPPPSPPTSRNSAARSPTWPGPGSTARVRVQPLAKPIVQDILIAVGLSFVALVGVATHLPVELPEAGAGIGNRPLDGLGIGLVLAQTIPLGLRRTAPVLVLATTTAALFTTVLLGYVPSLAVFGFLVALYSVAAHRVRRVSVPAGVATVLVGLTIELMEREPFEAETLIAESLIVAAAWFLGDGLRIRRSQVVQLEDRATRLEREREEWTQRAVAQERRVIARELHDVVAHNVSVIVAQAGAASRVFLVAPEEAHTALDAIERTGREALIEMRRLTGFLRTESDQHDVRSPQPGLNDLEVLVEQIRDAGVPTTLRVEGEPRPVPPGLDLSAFRIIQESLTNVLKHAGPTRAEVVVRYGTSSLQLVVSDDGRGFEAPPGPHRPGYGHLGIRERIALFGGQLRIGPRQGGGFEVAASLPIDGAPP